MIRFLDRLLWAYDWMEHDPEWQPAQLATGPDTTAPGYLCAHQLENGNGQCGGNVFRLDQAIGRHACIVRRSRLGGRNSGRD